VSFTDLLDSIKRSNLSEESPSEGFKAIKYTVLTANNPYEALGLQPGASKDRYRKAYMRSILQIHPDKNREEPWQTEATELFKVIQAAYASVS
jgi:DnaJ-class molecular chaperone